MFALSFVIVLLFSSVLIFEFLVLFVFAFVAAIFLQNADFFYYKTSIYVGQGKTMIKEHVRLHFRYCIGSAFPSSERAHYRPRYPPTSVKGFRAGDSLTYPASIRGWGIC